MVKINKDKLFEKILNSKGIYIIFLLGVIINLFGYDKILNIPIWLSFTKVFLTFSFIVIFFISRYVKYREYYKKKFKDKFYIMGFVTGVIILSLIGQSFLNIPINLIIKTKAKDSSKEKFKCEITNVITTNSDKLHFVFLDRDYSRYFNLKSYNRNELEDKYYLEIEARKSIFKTYYVDNIKIVKK